MEVKVYGSAHCVTSLKAKQWLEHHQLPYQFVDLEERDLSTEEAEELCSFEEVQAEQLFATWSEVFHNIAIDLSCVEKTTDFFMHTTYQPPQTSFDYYR